MSEDPCNHSTIRDGGHSHSAQVISLRAPPQPDLATLAPNQPSGDTNPCRMTGVTLHSPCRMTGVTLH